MGISIKKKLQWTYTLLGRVSIAISSLYLYPFYICPQRLLEVTLICCCIINGVRASMQVIIL